MPDTVKTVLIGDDDPMVGLLVSAILKKDNYNVLLADTGDAVLESIIRKKPDLILLDLKMPGTDGFAVCRKIRENPATSGIPIIILSGVSATEAKVTCIELGADDFITKPFDARELKARVERTITRRSQDVSVNPLTHLPGSPAIEEEALKRLLKGSLGFAYIDGDNFKAFNDVYGYARGDKVIKKIAEILNRQIASMPEAEGFAGHVGGDDFVLISRQEFTEQMAKAVAEEFDRVIPSYYDAPDRKRGYIVITDRKNNTRNLPLMTLTIAVVAPEKPLHYAKIVEAAAEMKQYGKNLANRTGSIFVRDRRN
ncbi:MAG: response regulator [bacterium]